MMRSTRSMASPMGLSMGWTLSAMRDSLMRKKACSTLSSSWSMPSACACAFCTVSTEVAMSWRMKYFSRTMVSQWRALAVEATRLESSLM